MKTDAPELKPCPFCGHIPNRKMWGEDKFVMLVCPEGSACKSSGLGTGYLLGNEEAAINAWNRRAPTPAPQGPTDTELEAIRESFDWDGWMSPSAAQRAFARAVLARFGSPQTALQPLTDEQIDVVAEGMPGGIQGFLKSWGYRQFAREILNLRAMPDWEPQFDCMTPGQEELVIKFCQEIAGLKGQKGSPPDPVRLLEMAEALYRVERSDARGIKKGGSDESK